MRRRRVLFIKLSQLKLFARKVLIALVFVSALAFIMLSKADTVILNKTTGLVSATLSPFIQVLQFPGKIVYKGYEKVRDITTVYSQNEKLKEENLNLLVLKNQISVLKSENKLLGNMLNYTSLPEVSFITAKVVAEEGDGFSHSMIVYTGKENTVEEQQVVLGYESVVGRVEQVQGKYAQIILITDINSKIPVIAERSRERAILSGDNTLKPKLLYTKLNADIQKGDRIVTSGVAGAFPVGLPVGIVSDITEDGIAVTPIADIERLEFVKIVNYDIYSNVVNMLGNKGI